jgi:hypothetical protein
MFSVLRSHLVLCLVFCVTRGCELRFALWISNHRLVRICNWVLIYKFCTLICDRVLFELRYFGFVLGLVIARIESLFKELRFTVV